LSTEGNIREQTDEEESRTDNMYAFEDLRVVLESALTEICP
jgi:hypothetical protein